MDNPKELLTSRELAERLGISRETVRQWVKRSVIPEIIISRTVRRFELSAVMDALRKRSSKGGNDAE